MNMDIILFDGDCVICSGWFRFVARRDPLGRFKFTAIQSAYGRRLATSLGINPDAPETNAVLLDGKIYLRSDSALAVLAVLPRWSWTKAIALVPVKWRDGIYLAIARNRYKLFGKRASCDLGLGPYADRIVHSIPGVVEEDVVNE